MNRVEKLIIEQGICVDIQFYFESMDPTLVDFTVRRSPYFEMFYQPDERGATLYCCSNQIDSVAWLNRVSLSRQCIKIETRGIDQQYEFDISLLDDEVFLTLKKHLILINFDRSFTFLMH